MSSFLPDFIRPPSTLTAPVPLPLFTAEQYTILSFRRDISRVNTLALACSRNAPRRTASRVASFTFESTVHREYERTRGLFRVIESRYILHVQLGGALIQKLYKYWIHQGITCYPFHTMNFLSESSLTLSFPTFTIIL